MCNKSNGWVFALPKEVSRSHVSNAPYNPYLQSPLWDSKLGNSQIGAMHNLCLWYCHKLQQVTGNSDLLLCLYLQLPINKYDG